MKSLLVLTFVIWGSLSASAFAQTEQETCDVAIKASDYAAAIDCTDRWFAAKNAPEAIITKSQILAKIGRRDDAVKLLKTHQDLLGKEEVASMVASLDTQRAQPEYVPLGGPIRPQEESSDGPDAGMGWMLLAGSGLALIGASVAFVASNAEANELRCSSSTSGDKDGCDGGFGAVTRSEFDSKSDTVSTLRFAGAILGGFAVALGGWGLYNVLGAPENDASVSVSPNDGGIDARFRLRF